MERKRKRKPTQREFFEMNKAKKCKKDSDGNGEVGGKQKVNAKSENRNSDSSSSKKKMRHRSEDKSRLEDSKSSNTNYNKRRKHVSSKTSNDVWFDGVDSSLIRASAIQPSRENGNKASTSKSTSSSCQSKLVKETSFQGLTKVVAMDCEMVGVGDRGSISVLARVSIVNFFGHCIYDKYVKPDEEVTDYRTFVSGIRPADLENAHDFKTVQKEVSDILDGRLLVGHAIENDLRVLFFGHPKHKIRDTSKYFKYLFGSKPSLKKLAASVLGVKIQGGEHDSVVDAQCAMRLYTLHKRDWERQETKKKMTKVKKMKTNNVKT